MRRFTCPLAHHRGFALLAFAALGLGSGGRAAPIDFQREVQPILAEHCSGCHGADAGSRQSGLRLDVRASALAGGDSGNAAITPGHAEQSELVRRITSPDVDERMPPAETKKPLSAAQIETLRQWIAEGAPYAAHWAFTAPQKAPLPPGGPTHPIDAIVAARLKSLDLQLSPAAAAGTLCRRIYLDLIGLPPSPAELTAFEKDGVAATVQNLLASDRYGEKWARHWLDVARYSDTNGYEKDLPRDQWIWRDWVIRALNDDMPYNRFIVEQIAGDLLPHATQDQIVATGFLRNSMINEEGAIVPEQFRMVEMFDRMDCIGKAALGMTTQCAQCHSHKFDPISHDEYYGLFAFFNNAYEARSWVYTPEQLQQIERIVDGTAAQEDLLRAARPSWQSEFENWQREILAALPVWKAVSFTQLESISGLNHPTQEADGSILMLGHGSGDVFFVGAPELAGVTGLRLEALNHGDLPFRGPGRDEVGGWGITELEVFAKPAGKDWEKLPLTAATADFSEAERKHGEGNKKASGPVGLLIDGTDETDWRADRGVGRRNQPSAAVVQFAQPLDHPAGTQIKVVLRMNSMLGCGRISLTTQPSPAARPIAHAAILALAIPPAKRTAEQERALFSAWRKTLPDAQSVNDEIEKLWAAYPTAPTSVLHLAEREPGNARTTHLLERGNWDKPLAAAIPHTPAALHPLGAEGEPPRLRFARWLVDERSPLAARVEVNRVWQALFGEGLVETSEDFGTRAPLPEYGQLLDWLAVDFMEHGWSQKRLIESIVTSAAYQQRSTAPAALVERDPRNRLLARGPRFRADAEVIRDVALTSAGLITQKLGGPAFIPPVPQNVLDYNFVYPSYWTPTQGPDRYRRAVYAFRKRSMPDPVMSSFDSPNGDFACARRVRSNTPLAALTSLNEPIFVEAAQALGLRILREGGQTDAARAQYAFLLCVSRPPTNEEQQEVLALLQSRRQRLAEGWLNPREIVTGDPAKLPELPPGATPQDAAAWTIVGRVLLNLDEALSKN